MCLPGYTFGDTAAKWDIILNNTWLFYTKKPSGSHPQNVNISFLTKKIKVEPKTIYRKRERRVHRRQAEQVLKSNRGQEGTRHAHNTSTVGESNRIAVDEPLTSTGPGLSASTSP